MAYCFNCRTEYPDDVQGMDQQHNPPCVVCPSDGHSPCQCGDNGPTVGQWVRDMALPPKERRG